MRGHMVQFPNLPVTIQTFNSKLFPKPRYYFKYYKSKLSHVITLQMSHVGLSLNDKIN